MKGVRTGVIVVVVLLSGCSGFGVPFDGDRVGSPVDHSWGNDPIPADEMWFGYRNAFDDRRAHVSVYVYDQWDASWMVELENGTTLTFAERSQIPSDLRFDAVSIRPAGAVYFTESYRIAAHGTLKVVFTDVPRNATGIRVATTYPGSNESSTSVAEGSDRLAGHCVVVGPPEAAVSGSCGAIDVKFRSGVVYSESLHDGITDSDRNRTVATS